MNVQSDTGSDVVFWVVDPLTGEPAAGLAARARRPASATAAPATPATRSTTSRPRSSTGTLGRVLPPSGSANADDLQDLLSLYLDQCKSAGGEMYAFGAKFDRNLHKPIDIEFGNIDGLHGIHDIHLNQGNVGRARRRQRRVPRRRASSSSSPTAYLGLFLAFQTQRVPTDAAGNAAPGSKPHQPDHLAEPVPQPADASAVTVYIEHALINPSGADPGREVVVLANLATTPQTLGNWRLLDKNGHVTPDQYDARAGSFVSVARRQRRATREPGRQSGPAGSQQRQVDAVTYTGEDALPDDRYVRFRR